MVEKFIAFDPGESIGFSVITDELELIDSGVAPINRDCSEAELFIQIVDWTREFLKKYPTTNRIGIEDAAFSPQFRNILTDEIRGLLKYAIALSGMQWEKVSISSVKKVTTGNGKAKKAQVKKGVEKILGVKLETSHAADACGVALYLLGKEEK